MDNSSSQSTNRPRTIQLSAPKITIAKASGVAQAELSTHKDAGTRDTVTSVVVTAAMLSAFERLATEAKDVVTLAAEAVRLVSTLPRVVAAGYLTIGQDGLLKVAAANWTGFVFERDEFRKELIELCSKVSRSRVRENFSSADLRNVVTWCVPLGRGDVASDVFTISVSTGPAPIAITDHQLIEHLIAALRTWHANHLAEIRDGEIRALAALVELVGMIECATSLSEACHAVVNELQKYLKCQRVAVAISSHSGVRLRTLSGLATFDSNSDTARQFQDACDETYARQTFAAWPPLNPCAEHSLIALKRLGELQNVPAVVAVPLMQSGIVTGTLILTGARESLLEMSSINLLRTAGPILGSALHQAKKLDGTWFTRVTRRMTASRWTSKLAVIGAIILVAVILGMPAAYRIRGRATLEPVTRRIVSAPYDGMLDASLLKSGDIVNAGELLARMDAREIRWELSTITAELSQATKQFDSELAAENIAKAQLAKMEAERLRRKQELLRFREDNHELKAPIAGMVLSGGVDKLDGTPVRMGQPLFEIAELNPLRLEVAVPADDFFHVRVGQLVRATFDGFDGEEFEGTIVRIRPRSEVRDDRNVFIAELEISNDDLRLRPGIEGHAVILGDRHSIAWNTFHKAWEAIWRSNPIGTLSGSSE